MDVGARLKEARIAKGLSLDSLQEVTKIQKRYLAAIEEGNFNILPGKFYARAFIKEYANAVGLDSNDLLEEHKEEIPKSVEDSEIQYTRVERSRRDTISSDRSGMIFTIAPKIILVLLILGIIIAAIWFITQSNSSDDPTEIEEPGNVIITNPNDGSNSPGASDDTDSEDTTDEEDIEEEEPAQEEDEMEFEVTDVATDSASTSTIELTNAGDTLNFVFESPARSWLDVQNADGEVFYAGFVSVEEGELELDLSGEESIYINAGSTPNLLITINDVELEYPIEPTELDVQKFWINIK
ncbi:helix-turn-helix domain-containing protein [Oceanobacillus sp. CAU 1775]